MKVNVGDAFRLPGSCSPGEYYEPSLMQCSSCPPNSSLTTSSDGFGCSCSEHSVPAGAWRCRACNVTELVSGDGVTCVPRRCQTAAGRVACRKCPRDYVTVTQNFDGSPMREVQCVKCARGYRVQDNRCVRCEACLCTKHDLVVAGACVPKKYLMDRDKYTENRLHPTALLEVIKLEYLCTEQDLRACRALGTACVRNFYTADMAGPCRLWLKTNLTIKGLPLLNSAVSKNGADVILEAGLDALELVLIEYTSSGGMKILENPTEGYFKCLPSRILIGKEIM